MMLTPRAYSQKGFSLVEVVVSTVIFLIAALGMFSIFSASRRSSVVSERDIIAANYGRRLLDNLRSKVDQRSPGLGLTCPAACPLPAAWQNWNPQPAPTPADPFDGTVRYRCCQEINGARKVQLQLNWTEP